MGVGVMMEILPTEDEEQATVCQYLEAKNIPYFAIPNDGKRSFQTGKRFKKIGLKAGVPDLFIPMPTPQYPGLFIEMKRKRGGIISAPQRFWIEQLRTLGYCARIAKGATAAINIIEQYLKT